MNEKQDLEKRVAELESELERERAEKKQIKSADILLWRLDGFVIVLPYILAVLFVSVFIACFVVGIVDGNLAPILVGGIGALVLIVLFVVLFQIFLRKKKRVDGSLAPKIKKARHQPEAVTICEKCDNQVFQDEKKCSNCGSEK